MRAARARAPALRRKLARIIAASSLVSLLALCAVAYVVIWLEDEADVDVLPEADDDPEAFLLLAFAVAAPLSLAITIPATLAVARRTLRPLEEVIDAAREMSVDRLDRRLAVPPGRDEVADVVTTLNDLFARLEAGLAGLHSFAADVSHELRTPLAVLKNELEVAVRKPRTDEEWRATATRSLRSIQRMVELVEALLELARGGIAEAREEVPLAELAEEVVGTFADRAARAGVALVHVSTHEPVARANRAAVGTALSAIVANAVRYTPRGGRVEVSVEDGVLRVDDSGPGVAPDERDAIFAPLVRGGVGKAEGTGLGLGLAIARRVARHHGGDVTVEPSPLGGARFTLRLPAFTKS